MLGKCFIKIGFFFVVRVNFFLIFEKCLKGFKEYLGVYGLVLVSGYLMLILYLRV